MALNPNWPLLGADLWPNALGWTDINPRMIEEWSTSRGRQFELDAVQPGQFRTVWRNEDGALDPSNGTGPYSPYLAPYNPIRVRAQWPPTVNRLTGDQATGGEATPLSAGTNGGSFGLTSFYGTVTVTASGSAFQGVNVWQTAVAGGASTGGGLLVVGQSVLSIAPGVTYTFSGYVRSATASQNPQAYLYLKFMDVNNGVVAQTNSSTVTLTGSPSAAWTRFTVTATAAANAVHAEAGFVLAAAPASAWSFQADGLQFETGPGATAFATPGTWYPVYSGLVERYPQSWRYRGGYGIVRPTCVDQFTQLSQTPLPDPFTAVATSVGGVSPSMAYLLDEPSGVHLFYDSTGTYAPAPAVDSKFGGGAVTPGTAQASASTAGAFLGSAQTVTTFSGPTTAGTNLYGNPMSAINLSAGAGGALGRGAGAPGPGSGTGRGFTRMIAFRCTQVPTVASALFWASMPTNYGQNVICLTLDSALNFALGFQDAAHSGPINLGTYDVGNWHIAWIGVNAAGSLFLGGLDNAATVFATSGSAYTFTNGFAQDLVGAAPFGAAGTFDTNSFVFNFVGDLAMVIEWPTFLTAAQTVTVYNAWRTAFSGDTSGQRYARILGWAGYTGPTSIDTGNSLNLGPASDVAGKDALAALAAVVETENGNHYVAADGTVTFRSRSRRYNALTPAYTFGENTTAGELPYEDLSFDFDPTRLGNQAAVTQSSTGAVFSANDTTSQASYKTKLLQRENQSAVAAECQDAATYLVARNKDPHMRVASLRLHPSADVAQWPAALAMELGTRVRVNRRPPGGSQITVDGFIEKIDIKNVRKDVTVNFEVSPADPTFYGLFASLHAVTAAPTSGAVVTLGRLPDWATNPPRASLADGQQLVINPGGATTEVMTIAPGGVQNVSPGYTTFTVTMTANLAHGYSSGFVVCEVLPSGVTDPTTWDTAAAFGAAKFAY